MDIKNDLGIDDVAKELRRVARLMVQYNKIKDGELPLRACEGLARKLASELNHWVENMVWEDD